MNSPLKGKTYEEIMGVEKALILKRKRVESNKNRGYKGKTLITRVGERRANEIATKISNALKLVPRKKYKPKKKKEFVCKYCSSSFLAADVKANICSECNKVIKVTCSCGCGELVDRPRYLAVSKPHFKHGHHLKGKTYKQIYENKVPTCGFVSGEKNPVFDPKVKQKIANFHTTKSKQSNLEKKLIPYLPGWNAQYQIGWYTVDFANIEEKKVLEVNGCYWHCCQKCGFLPKKKDQFTAVTKDKRIKTYLENRGWSLEVLWEHDVEKWIQEKSCIVSENNLNFQHPIIS